MSSSFKKIALYASYQAGDTLPGYVEYALKKLAATDFHVVLLTNHRDFSNSTYEFLAENGIELFLTENHGYDFGMWRRYLQLQADHEASLIANATSGNMNSGSFNTLERLLLINDSIVYYKNIFPAIFAQAEASKADAISLTSSNEILPHLQSFFLYLKQPALGAFYTHLFETPEQSKFYDVVRRLEVGLSETFSEAGIYMKSLHSTEQPALFAYEELIQQGAGFIKRKLLQRRFTRQEFKHFIRFKAYKALVADYNGMIIKAGVDPDFDIQWLPKPTDLQISKRIAGKAQIEFYQHLGWPLLRTAIKAKYKILRRELKGEEYK